MPANGSGLSSSTTPPNSLESSPPTASTTGYGVAEAAALSTLVTKSLLHPIDTMKCRAQACPAEHYYGKGFLQYYKGKWTPGHLYGGLPIKLAVYIPYQSIYMTSYDLSRSRFSSMWGGGGADATWVSRTGVALSAAVVAEGATAVVRVPMEAVKIRIQSTAATNTQFAVSQLWRHGLRNVSRLFVPQTLCSDLPYSCIQWITYENVKPRLKEYLDNTFGKEGVQQQNENSSRMYAAAKLGSSFAVGGCSGFMASALTIPLDVIKTRVIIMSSSAQYEGAVPGFVATGRSMVRTEGLRSLYRGGQWRVLWIASNTAVYFCIFERLKEIL